MADILWMYFFTNIKKGVARNRR